MAGSTPIASVTQSGFALPERWRGFAPDSHAPVDGIHCGLRLRAFVRAQIPHSRRQVAVSHQCLNGAKVDTISQERRRIGAPKFVKIPALTLLARLATLAGLAVQPCIAGEPL